jgi:hypothetical protein
MGAQFDQPPVREALERVEDCEQQDSPGIAVSVRALNRPGAAKYLIKTEHGVLVVGGDVVAVGIREQRRVSGVQQSGVRQT